MKNPILPCPYLVKKRKFCQNYTILWAQKVNRMPFIPIFTNKYQPSCPHFLQNNVYYQKKKSYSHAHILSKKRPFSQKQYVLMSPFQFFYEKPLLSCPHLVKKTSILSKLHYIMGQIKSIVCPFADFSWNKLLSCHYFVRKCPFSTNTMLSCPYSVKKSSNLSKTNCFM